MSVRGPVLRVRLAVLTLTASSLLLVAPTHGAVARSPTLNCRPLVFEQQSVARAIHATGVGCPRARQVAEVTRTGRFSPEVAQRKRSYRAHGFHCVGLEPQWLAGIPPINYTCRSGAEEITFIREGAA